MDKKPLAYYGIVVLVLIGLVVFLSLYYNPENLFNNRVEMSKSLLIKVDTSVDHGAQKALGISLIGAFGMIMLAGYLFWVFYRKIQKNRQTDPLTMENYLYEISLETGRNEYDLFCKSAENWAISGDRIDYDFKRYLIDQSLPYYVKDFVRKNHEHVDESLIKKEELKPTSIWDYAIALLVFPGCFLFLVLMPILFCK